MKKEYMEAFAEVNEIIKMMPKELVNKIPIKFREMVEEERDKEYNPSIQEPLEKCKLKNETIIILGLIYRDFLCSQEERKKLQEKDARELKEVEKYIEEESRKKYDPNAIFKDRKTNIIEKIQQNQESNALILIKEEKWYQKIFNIIKGLFKKNM